MKTTFNYDHYYIYEELSSNLNYFKEHYPNLVQIESICTTFEHKEVWAVTISGSGNAMEKPAFYIDANTHAGEVTGSMAAMHTIDYLCTNSNQEDVKKLLDQFTFYVIPRITPDGAETYLTSYEKLRSVNRPYPYQKKQPGLHECDLDGDGVMRMMRMKSKFGAWKISKENPLLMEKRLPDERDGEFYNVYAEGLIEDYDGINVPIAPNKWGLDFNRNYPFGWFSEVRQPGAGSYPLSNPENKAVVDFVLAHPNIGAVATHHTSGGVILYPPGTKPEKKAFSADMKRFREIGAMATEEMGYPTINIFDHFMIDQENYSSGAFDDWCYQNQGIPAYTLELWNLMERCGCKIDWDARKEQITEDKIHELSCVLKWCVENTPESIKPWTNFEHPQLGQVEIGGIEFKFTNQNPPKQFLLQEVEKTTKFSLRYAKTLPLLEIENIQVMKQVEGIYKVEVLIANTGYLPTYLSDEAKALKVAKEIEVSLDGAKAVISGKKTEKVGHLEGFSGINTDYSRNAISTENHAPLFKQISWVIQAEEGDCITITANSEKAGKVIKTINIK